MRAALATTTTTRRPTPTPGALAAAGAAADGAAAGGTIQNTYSGLAGVGRRRRRVPWRRPRLGLSSPY